MNEEVNRASVKELIKDHMRLCVSDAIMIYKMCLDNDCLNEQFYLDFQDSLNRISVL